MSSELTSEQEECVRRAVEGHNFLIFGEGGTGKSHVISSICKAKEACVVPVVCSGYKENNTGPFLCKTKINYAYFRERATQWEMKAKDRGRKCCWCT